MFNMKTKVLTVKEIVQIEEKTEKEFGITRQILMENAGRSLAEIVLKKLSNYKDKRVWIFAGKGNNGGDGFVAARYLFNFRVPVKVFFLGTPDNFTQLSFTNFNILHKMNIITYSVDKLKLHNFKVEAPILVDALFGSGIKGELKEPTSKLVSKINESKKFVICADIPSGLNPDTGEVCGSAIKGNITVSFGFSKKGFYINQGPEYCGEIKIVDIGFPAFFYND